MTESTILPAEDYPALASLPRLEALRNFVPDMTEPDSDFDALTAMAATVFQAPVALVTLLDIRDQWFKSAVGVDQTSAPARSSFCAHVIDEAERGELVVLDATKDPRFMSQPFVAAEPFLRFYAGVPILIEGQAVGTVCVFDVQPREQVDPTWLTQLHRLSEMASALLRLKHESRQRALKEAEISREEQRHEMALDAANIGSWLWNIRTGEVSCNHAMTRMFGMEPSVTIQAKDIFAAIHPDDRLAALSRLRTAMANGEEYDGLFRVTKGGRWLLGRGRVHERDSAGRPSVFLGINVDVTEEQTSNQRTRLLLRELNHRVKNTLAMLQSLARQTLRTTSDPKQFMTAFAGRLQAISEAHGLLSDHEWGAIRLSALLHKQLAPHVRDYDRQVEIHKDEILLGPDQAVGLGLVLHELATNAAKYGALTRAEGTVIITARKVDEDGMQVLRMIWTEVGGPPVAEPDRKGFGSILIERSLDKVMGSSVEVQYLPAGVTALVRLPL
ncbi:PAS domain S-box-containing protein [Pararhizobium capsulatum DSM 1112]|uniref:Blue-light-activated histidine kinase n=1 Tax=Pararhizobium capsulatum DSM 1112 TaxID=1121113 RepID=A0ABU0BSY8_9HYPH|nr:HWE histidine kinase domain-containing protein [Pararhizobium capsulatum]MDQ0321371.1 PAS domain S-box-containing protein [Pararhizobium capsulatum DSM 1112]